MTHVYMVYVAEASRASATKKRKIGGRRTYVAVLYWYLRQVAPTSPNEFKV